MELIVGPLLILGAILLMIPISAPIGHAIARKIEGPLTDRPCVRIRRRAVIVADLIDEETGEFVLCGEDEGVALTARDSLVGREGRRGTYPVDMPGIRCDTAPPVPAHEQNEYPSAGNGGPQKDPAW